MFKVLGLVLLSFALAGNAVSGVLPETQSDRYLVGAQQQILLVAAEVTVETKKLFDAVKKRDIEAVRVLIDAGADVNAKNKYGITPLHLAASIINGVENGVEIVSALIVAGADVNAKSKEHGLTSLHVTVSLRNTELVRILIAAGADVNAKNKYDITPLHLATLIRNGVEIVSALIVAGADVNAIDKAGRTPLSSLDWNEDAEVVRLLLDAGATYYYQ